MDNKFGYNIYRVNLINPSGNINNTKFLKEKKQTKYNFYSIILKHIYN